MAKKPNGKSGKSGAKRVAAKTTPGNSTTGTGPQSGAPFADPVAAQSAQQVGQLPQELRKWQEQAERGHQPVTSETAGKPTVSQMLGEITWLLSMSPATRLWVVDLIDLTGNSQQNIVAELKATVCKGQTFKYHRMEPDGRRVTVTEQVG